MAKRYYDSALALAPVDAALAIRLSILRLRMISLYNWLTGRDSNPALSLFKTQVVSKTTTDTERLLDSSEVEQDEDDNEEPGLWAMIKSIFGVNDADGVHAANAHDYDWNHDYDYDAQDYFEDAVEPNLADGFGEDSDEPMGTDPNSDEIIETLVLGGLAMALIYLFFTRANIVRRQQDGQGNQNRAQEHADPDALVVPNDR